MKHLIIVVTALGLVGLVPRSEAQAPPQRKYTESETKVIRSKLEPYQLANLINFRTIYDLPFRSLATLGERIEQARRAMDPIALGNLSNEIEVYEAISKKKAPLTSDELLKEAVHLAQMRHVPEELQALSLLAEEEKDVQAALQKQAQVAQQQEDERQRQLQGGERPKGLDGTLVVVNNTDDVVEIIIDGVDRGSVQPFQTAQFFVNDNPYLARTYCQAIVNGEGVKASIQLERPYLNSYQWVITET